MHTDKTPRPEKEGGSPASRRIVAAARRHFLAHGFRSVTMDDLAEELGMSKRTLYACFRTKRDLVEAVLSAKFREAHADFERITSRRASDVPAVLRELLECLQGHAGEIQPAFINDVKREGPELFKLVEKHRRELIQHYFGRLFCEGRRTGAIRKDIPAGLIIEILLGATEAIVNPTRLTELDLTPRAGYAAIITVIFEGVITKSGGCRA